MTRSDILRKLGDIQPDIQGNFHAEIKGFFGSYARGDQDSDSDLDLLVDFGPEADLFDFVGLSDFLEEKLHCHVDLVPINSIREEIKAQILAEAVYL